MPLNHSRVKLYNRTAGMPLSYETLSGAARSRRPGLVFQRRSKPLLERRLRR